MLQISLIETWKTQSASLLSLNHPSVWLYHYVIALWSTYIPWLSCWKCETITRHLAHVCIPNVRALKSCLALTGIWKRETYIFSLFFFSRCILFIVFTSVFLPCCCCSSAFTPRLTWGWHWHTLCRLWCFLFILWWKQQKIHLKPQTTTEPVTTCVCVCTQLGWSADTQHKHPQSVLKAQQYTKHRLQI